MLLKGKTILIIDQEKQFSDRATAILSTEGYEIKQFETLERARQVYDSFDPCIVMIGYDAEEKSALDLCKWIRFERQGVVPIMMFRPSPVSADRIAALKAGADDLIEKGLEDEELVLRVQAVLRRTAGRCGKISFKGFTLKPVKGEVWYDGEQLELTAYEFGILQYLMQHPGQVLSRQQILESVDRTREKEATERTVDVHIKRLRHKISQLTDEQFIYTVRGLGYKFEVSK